MDDLIVAVGGRKFYGRSHERRAWVLREGLEDWFDSPETQFTEDMIPEQDGAVDPDEVFVGPRRITVNLRASSSSEEYAAQELRPWAASLAKSKDLDFAIHMGGRWLRLRKAKIRGRVRTRRLIDGLTEFQLPVWAADPRKYGDSISSIVNATVAPVGGLGLPVVDGALNFGVLGAVSFPGVFQVRNPGTADFYPTFRVRGKVASFTITSEDRVIEYASPVGSGQELSLSPYLGGRAVLDGVDVSQNLTQAGWVPVEGGQTRGYFFNATDPGLGAQLEVTYPNGAWW